MSTIIFSNILKSPKIKLLFSYITRVWVILSHSIWVIWYDSYGMSQIVNDLIEKLKSVEWPWEWPWDDLGFERISMLILIKKVNRSCESFKLKIFSHDPQKCNTRDKISVTIYSFGSTIRKFSYSRIFTINFHFHENLEPKSNFQKPKSKNSIKS